MIDKVWARTHFRRGTKGGRDLRWDSVGSSGVLSGVLGVTKPHDDRKAGEKHVWLHLSWRTKECMSGCDE